MLIKSRIMISRGEGGGKERGSGKNQALAEFSPKMHKVNWVRSSSTGDESVLDSCFNSQDTLQIFPWITGGV